MHLYLERRIAEPITKDAAVKFDQLIDVSKKLVYQSEEQNLAGETFEIMALDESSDEQYDFAVVDQCYIDILNVGNYLIEWAARSMTGFSNDAPWFELRYLDDEVEGVWKTFGPDPAPGVTKGTSGVGTLPLQVTEEMLLAHGGKFRIALFNAASNSITLHRTASVKASLIIYGIPAFEGIIDELLKKFYSEKERCCVILSLPRVVELENHEALQYLRICLLYRFREKFLREFEDHFYPYEFAEFTCYNFGSRFPTSGYTDDLRVKVLKIGTFYLFTLHGKRLGTTTNATFRYTNSTVIPPSTTNAYFLRSEPYSSTIDANNTTYTDFGARRYFPPLKRIPSGAAQLFYPFASDTRANSQGSASISSVVLDDKGIYFEFPGGNNAAYNGPTNIDYGFSIGVIIPDVKDSDGNTIPDDFSVFPYV